MEIDFPDITKRKIEVIKNVDKLQQLVFGDATPEYSSDEALSTSKYALFPVDLRNSEALQSALQEHEIWGDVPTLLLAECLFCYIENSATEQALSTLTSYFSDDIAIISYDIINPMRWINR